MTRHSFGSTDDGEESSSIDPDLAAELDSRPSGLKSRPLSTRVAHRPSNLDWNQAASSNGNGHASAKPVTSSPPLSQSPTLPATSSGMGHPKQSPPARHRSYGRRFGTWSISLFALCTAALGLLLLGGIVHSLVTRQQDVKGCRMSYMRPSYIHLREFDTEHTRFATKYSLHLYREEGLDDETKVRFDSQGSRPFAANRHLASRSSGHFHPRQCWQLQASSTHCSRSSQSLLRTPSARWQLSQCRRTQS